MTIKRIFRAFLILTILASNIGCDQISKHLVRQRIDYREHIGFIDNHVTLTRVENSGAFLSLGTSLTPLVKIFLLSIMPLIFIGFVCMYLLTTRNLSYLAIFGICSIMGGGMGNIYDRLIHGSVTDFLHIDFILFQTGIFNLADVSIMTGVLIVILDTYFSRKKLIKVSSQEKK